MFVAIEGCIACGKSSTAELVASDTGMALVLEQTSNHPFLGAFYANPVQFALETELIFPLLHYHQLYHLQGGDMISDFAPMKDLVFAQLNLHGEDLDLFRIVYQSLSRRLPQPDIVVFIDLPIEECWRRCIARGRPYEAGITTEYLYRLRAQYEKEMNALGTRVAVMPVVPRQSQRQVADAALEIIRSATAG